MMCDDRTDYFDSDTLNTTLVSVAGYVVILGVFVIIYIVDDTHHLLELIFLIIGAVLNLICGILNLIGYIDHKYSRSCTTLIMAIMCIVAGILMVVDFIRELKNK